MDFNASKKLVWGTMHIEVCYLDFGSVYLLQ